MIDIHCHILPGVPDDDGSPDLEMTKKMLDQAQADGITSIICTPHGNPKNKDQASAIARILEEITPLAAENGITLYRGLEYNLPQLLNVSDRSKIIPLADSNFVMIDFVQNRISTSLDSVSHQMYSNQFIPVCAHPERLFQTLEQVKHISDYGYFLQLTATSVIGGFGRECQRLSLQLLDHGLCHYIASDAHNTSRTFHSSECRKFILERYGERTASILFDENPARLLRSEKPLRIENKFFEDDDDDLPKNKIMRFFYKKFIRPRDDDDD